MITYEEVLTQLKNHADEQYRAFHKKLLKNDNIAVIGVRTPILRSLAKAWKNEKIILTFPDEYYEVTFLKCAVASFMPYAEFITVVDGLVSKLDNWATCDCFCPKCISKNKAEFLPYIEKYARSEEEFVHRFALTTLLHFYVDAEYLPYIFEKLLAVEESAPYYVKMAAAWLLCEVFVKFYDEGVVFVEENTLARSILNKGIQKACESFRLTSAQKNHLKSFKR